MVDWPKVYYGVIGVALAGVLSLIILSTFLLAGEAPPLPWVPVLNPLDAVTLIGVLCIATLWLDLGRLFSVIERPASVQVAWVCLAAAGFVWLNVTLFRALHFWQNIPYDLDALLASSVAHDHHNGILTVSRQAQAKEAK